MRVSSIMYPAIHAKLNGMYSQKLKKADFEELMKQNTTTQVIALLKNLSSDFNNLEDNPQRIKIKKLLDDILIKDIKKIYRLLNQQEKRIFENFISIYEIKCIKSIFRKLSSGNIMQEKSNDVENWTTQLFKHLSGLAKVKNYEEFIQILKKTSYIEIFQKYSSNIEEINVFNVENQLDKFYFENMMNLAKKNNRKLENMIGQQVDLNNILWIYRTKKNYNFSKEQCINVCIPFFYQLKKKELENLLQTNTVKEMINILKKTFYARYINFENTSDFAEQIDQYLYRLYKKCFRNNIFEISAIYAYINMIEQENNDIMNIVEGIRYGLSKEEILKKLI